MSQLIAVAGKGGTGKTTLSALIIRYLIKNGLKPILAIDADPNMNLNEVLGIEIKETVGSLREEIRANVDKIPESMPKENYIELRLQEAIVETEDYDLVAMGIPEGRGCYCYVNSVLQKYIEILSKNYPFQVMDNEAGMEHLSRGTTKNVSQLIIVSDPSPRGIVTASRIKELMDEIKVKVDDYGLVISRLPQNELPNEIEKALKKSDLKFWGTIPLDNLITEYDLYGRSLLDLPDNSEAVIAIDNLLNWSNNQILVGA